MPSGFIADRQYVKYDNSNPERAAGEILKFVLFKAYDRERAVGMMVDMLAKAKSETECDALMTAIISEKEMAPKQRHDPQLRIEPSMPIILQMCAPKHATFV